MEHVFKDKVYYADTDAYGVVWHGSYLKWMEKGRVLFCDDLGLDLVDLKGKDVAIPVANLNIKYKSPAMLNEYYEVKTVLTQITPLSLTFNQVIYNPDSSKIYTIADVTVVAVNNEGKLYRRLPESITKFLKEDIVCSD